MPKMYYYYSQPPGDGSDLAKSCSHEVYILVGDLDNIHKINNMYC